MHDAMRAVLITVILLFVGTLDVVSVAAEYVRPPAGRVIFTENTQPASHPQQVCVSIKLHAVIDQWLARPTEC